MSRPAYSIVIPAYNSAPLLEELHRRIAKVMADLGVTYEIIFVNDASLDRTLDVLKAIQAADPNAVVIDLMRNYGQHNALMCGFGAVSGDYVVTLDDDLQHPPEEIPKLVAEMAASGADAVIGRYTVKAHAPLRNFGTWMLKFIMTQTLGVPRDLELTSFRLLTRRVVDAVIDYRTPNPRIGLVIFDVTRRIVNVDVEHHARRNGRSTYSLRRLLAGVADNVVYYSALPLRLLAYAGFVTASAAALLTAFYLAKFLVGGIGVSGFTTLVLLLLFFMGLTMCAFGIVGEYMIRVIRAAERKPQFVIRETIRGDKP